MKTLLSALFLSALTATPAMAGAVTGWTATDGFGAVPLAKGRSVLDVRINANMAGNSVAAPVMNIVTGAADGIELGLGTTLSSNPTRAAIDNVYPWLRAALPFSTETVKTGFMIGGILPAANSTSEALPGVTGLMDLVTGPVTTGINLGYSRGLSSQTNWGAANVNFTLPFAGLTWYEEQFVNVPMGGNSNGGVRGSAIIPVSETVACDVTPALLWTNDPTGTTWTFSPNVGLTMLF